MAELIDGKKISQDLKDEVKDKVASLKEHHGIDVTLAVILVGADTIPELFDSIITQYKLVLNYCE